MKKNLIFILFMLFSWCGLSAQGYSFKDTFDSNSLEWTECGEESEEGSSIIDKGVLTIKSKGVNKFASAMLGKQVGETTVFESHCYAPIDIMKPFKITTNVKIDKLSNDKLVGFIFNYKDNGNYYCFTFNENTVYFRTFINNKYAGGIAQGVGWKDKSKVEQEWTLISDNEILSFFVDGVPILKVKHMPIKYSGVGFYTWGKQKLIVDDIEFIEY